jgi:hypothetical protein
MKTTTTLSLLAFLAAACGGTAPSGLPDPAPLPDASPEPDAVAVPAPDAGPDAAQPDPDAAEACVPAECAKDQCGFVADGCGGWVGCGACPCGIGNPGSVSNCLQEGVNGLLAVSCPPGCSPPTCVQNQISAGLIPASQAAAYSNINYEVCSPLGNIGGFLCETCAHF